MDNVVVKKDGEIIFTAGHLESDLGDMLKAIKGVDLEKCEVEQVSEEKWKEVRNL